MKEMGTVSPRAQSPSIGIGSARRLDKRDSRL